MILPSHTCPRKSLCNECNECYECYECNEYIDRYSRYVRYTCNQPLPFYQTAHDDYLSTCADRVDVSVWPCTGLPQIVVYLLCSATWKPASVNSRGPLVLVAI